MTAEKKIFKTEDASVKTVDGFNNFASKLGLNNDNTLSAGVYIFNLVTRNRVQLEAAYRGSWIVGAVVDTIAEDMTRAGVDVTSNDADDEIKDLLSETTRLNIWPSLSNLIKWGRLYGGAIGVLQVEGQDLATPLDISKVTKKQFRGVVVYDRWQLNPDLTNYIKQGPDTGLPEYYYITTSLTSSSPVAPTTTGEIKVHHSRCIRMIGIQLPFFQAITEMMWGESVLERLWDRLISFDSATMSCANLIERANNRMIGIENFREVIAGGGPAAEGLRSQFEFMRLLQTNEGLTVTDKNDTFQTYQYSFAGLSDVMLQFGQQLAGASGIPLIRLFGQPPSGLSATGDSDIRMYYDNILAQQESRLRDGMEKILKLTWASKFGKPAPEDMEFTFVPLWQMSEMDKANIAKLNTETVIGAHEDGLISTESAMRELRDMSGNTGLFSNITDEEIAEAEQEEPPQPDLGLGAPPETPTEERNEPVPPMDKKSPMQKIKDWLARKR